MLIIDALRYHYELCNLDSYMTPMKLIPLYLILGGKQPSSLIISHLRSGWQHESQTPNSDRLSSPHFTSHFPSRAPSPTASSIAAESCLIDSGSSPDCTVALGSGTRPASNGATFCCAFASQCEGALHGFRIEMDRQV
jgi:hypothetical protein